jgi:hypothetical protein
MYRSKYAMMQNDPIGSWLIPIDLVPTTAR